MVGKAKVVTFVHEGDPELSFIRVLLDIAYWIEANPPPYNEEILMANVAPLPDGRGARGELVIQVYGEKGDGA